MCCLRYALAIMQGSADLNLHDADTRRLSRLLFKGLELCKQVHITALEASRLSLCLDKDVNWVQTQNQQSLSCCSEGSIYKTKCMFLSYQSATASVPLLVLFA